MKVRGILWERGREREREGVCIEGRLREGEWVKERENESERDIMSERERGSIEGRLRACSSGNETFEMLPDSISTMCTNFPITNMDFVTSVFTINDKFILPIFERGSFTAMDGSLVNYNTDYSNFDLKVRG